MSADNAQLVRATFDAFLRGDFNAVREAIDPEAQWLWHQSGPWDCHNRDEVLDRMRERHEEGIVAGLKEVLDAGDDIVVTITGPRMFNRFETDVATLVVTLAQRRIVLIRDFRGREEALHAAGLGPAPPTAPVPTASGPGADRVVALTPFVRVRDTRRSVRFYEQLGFDVRDTFHTGDDVHWAFLEASPEGRIMLEHTEDPIEPGRQAVLFYLYSHDLPALRDRLVAAGIDAGDIVDGRPGPRWEMTLTDPDGYVLTVAQIAADGGA